MRDCELCRQVWHGLGEGIGLAAGVIAVFLLFMAVTRRPAAPVPAPPQPIRDPRLVAALQPQLAPARVAGVAGGTTRRACSNPWL